MSEAKDYLKSRIRSGQLTKDEFTNPDSVYNKLKHLLMNNSGYMGYFVRSHYKNPNVATMDKLQELFNNLIELKERNINIDISKHSKTPFEKFSDMISTKLQSAKGQLLPGFIIPNNFPELYEQCKNTNWIPILCIKKEGGGWVPDLKAVQVWGSPKWCIKRSNHFNDNYVKTPDHLQWVFIKREFFEKVTESALEGANARHKLCTINFGSDYDKADHYSNPLFDNPNLRIGVTTKASEDLNFFNHKDNLTSFNDSNQQVPNIETFNNHTGGFPLRFLDIEVRKLLNLRRSEFDISIPEFSEIISNIGLDPNQECSNELVAKACGKFVSIMEKLWSKPENFYQIQEQIEPYFMKNKKLLYLMLYVLVYIKEVSDETIQFLEELYDKDEKHINAVPTSVTMNLVSILLENKSKGIETDPRIVEVVKERVVKQTLVHYLLQSFIKDKPKSTLDLKRSMIKVFRMNEEYTQIDGPGSLPTRSKLFKVVSNFLYIYDREYGEKIMHDEGWQDEIDFIKEIEEKSKAGDTGDSPELERIARNILEKLPGAMSDKVETKRITPTYEQIFEDIHAYRNETLNYEYDNHSVTMMIALYYYLTKINKDLEREFQRK